MSVAFTPSAHTLGQVMARRGKLHLYDSLDPARTALVVIDMQNAFLKEGVTASPCLAAQEIVPNINHLADHLRQIGGQVYWVQNTHTDATLQDWSNMYGAMSPLRQARRIAVMSQGTEGHAFWSEMDIRPQDHILPKTRYSAFLPGYCDLPRRLQMAGIDTVLITGTVTNTCCESSARDAMMLNFKTIMVSDGNAAHSHEEHNASLSSFFVNFGDVMSTAEICARLSPQEIL